MAALVLAGAACRPPPPTDSPVPTFQPAAAQIDAKQASQDPALMRAQEHCANLLHGLPAASKDGNDLASACIRQQLSRERQRSN